MFFDVTDKRSCDALTPEIRVHNHKLNEAAFEKGSIKTDKAYGLSVQCSNNTLLVPNRLFNLRLTDFATNDHAVELAERG